MNIRRKIILGAMIILLVISGIAFSKKTITRINDNGAEIKQALTETEQAQIGKESKITSAIITQMKTGTGPWDDNDDVGNDSSDDNDIVRSFDQITYTIESTMALKSDATVENFRGGIIKIEAVLPDECEGVMDWDLNSMGWAEGSGVISENGKKLTAEYKMGQNDVTIPGKQNIVLVLSVKGASNNTQIAPSIKMWLDGNDESDKTQVSDVQTVRVSAAANYNVVLTNNDGLRKEIEYTDGGETKKGRLYGYGITYQLYNEQIDKGLKGIEYPNGDMNLDVELKLTKTNMNDTSDVQDITSTTTPFLYNYKLNYYDDSTGVLPDRDMNVTWHAAHLWRIPGAKRLATTDTSIINRYCYDSGNVTMNQTDNLININVKDYKFDGQFPIYAAGTGVNDPRVYTDNIGCFSTVYFQVLVPYTDETTEGGYNYYLDVEAKNFSTTSNSGTKVNSEMKATDNSSSLQHVIYLPGSFSTYNWLTEAWDRGENGLYSYYTYGDARAYVGQDFVYRYDFTAGSNNDSRQDVYSVDVLMKFDGEAFNSTKINGVAGNKKAGVSTNATRLNDIEFKMLYAAKKDGTNWSDDDEMKKLVEADLLYYESVDDLKAELGENAVCVGILFESVSGHCSFSSGCALQIALNVTQNAEIGKVYQFVSEANLYYKDNQLDRNVYTRLNRDVEIPKSDVLLKYNYIKSAYDENGNIIAGTHNGSYSYGQSLLIIGGKIQISNDVEDRVEDGSVKVNYDIGRNEYEVKYKLTPTLSMANKQGVNISNVTVTVNDTLPVGLTYVPGSSNYDEPEIIKNDDGTTTLVWKIYNCTTNTAITPIIFSAKIDEETPNGKQFETVALVEADKIGASLPSTRTAKHSVQVTNLSSYSLYKTTETPIIEINGLIHYKITCINKTDDPIKDFQLLDILPYNGDNRGTNYNGTYTVKNINVNLKNSSGTAVDASGLKLYVSNEESVKTNTDVKDENLGLTSEWRETTGKTDYDESLTAYALIGEIGPRNRLEVDIYLKTNGNRPRDVYKNSATAQIDKNTEKMETSIILVQDIKRSVEGTVWFDSNKDGIMDDNEEKLQNVQVELLQEDGSQAVDIDGDKIEAVLTDADGHYEFENMVRGKYRIQVNITDDEKEITLKDVGENKEINSKFNEDRRTDLITSLDSLDIPVINEKFVNAGITYKDTSVVVHHYIKGTATSLSPDVTINGKIHDEYTTTKASDIPEYYELVTEPENKNGTMTKDKIEVTYYYQLKKYPYTVNYLEKGTNKVIHQAKNIEEVTYGTVINSDEEVIKINGYNYDSVDKNSLTIGTGENVINIYYTKKDTKVTVHYYEEGTTNKVSNDVEIPGKVFDNYETESASDIPSKYELVAVPENKNGTMTEDEITVIYYYRKKATQVIVHYYEENTTKKLSEDVTINGRVDDPYTTVSADDIPIKYELVAEPVNKSGSMTEATIEVIYYYRVKDAVVHVRYLEKGTDIVLADSDRLDGKVDEDYQTTPKEIDGYQLVEHTGNEKGKFEVEPLTITYYYLYKTKATVQYIDKITGEILDQSTTEGLEGDDFVTESKDFENYVLVEEPPEKTVKMTKEEQVLKYYYIHISGGVIEKHIDIISNEILANAAYEGNEGDEYDIPSRTFDGYDLVEDKLPENAKGTMKVEPVDVIYYYIYRSKVTAEYIDKNTGEKLTDDVTQKGHDGDNYTTERKTFDDYKLVEVPANADGSMTKDDITVTYYYVHTSGGVIVNHIDIKTGKQLLDETKEEGYEGDPYETHEENIPEYDLVKEKYPENAVGKMTIEPTRVTYYYIKKTEVNIKYVDKETGEEIDEPTNIPGHEGDDYTTEPKDVPGYDLIEEPENKDGTMTADPIDVIYYYKRPAKVIVNYYDIDTKEKLADEIEITGYQNDDYTTEQKDIKYYEIAKIPENKEGKMTVTVTKDENDEEIVDNTTYVDYYYRKLIFNLRVDKTIASVIVNGQETVINGTLGKVEVHRKNISNANVKVVYKIKVTNDGELTGKANVVENIPSGMTMLSENNPDWTIKGMTASLETDEIKPGESREYQVVLGWQNGDNNVGTKTNMVSITTENEANFDEQFETDNVSKADLIVAVGTGEVPYAKIAGGVLIIMIAMTAGIYVIRKRK